MMKRRMEKIANEIEIYKQISKDATIVTFYGWTLDTDCCRIFMEPMEISLEKAKKYSNHHTIIYGAITSVLKALKTCKALNISHGDLKPDNIMINAFGDIKLGDFGESHRITKTTRHPTGALAYWAPENFDLTKAICAQNEEKFNVWSLGIIGLETLLGENLMLKFIGKREFYELPEYQNFFIDTPYEKLIKLIKRVYFGYYFGYSLERFIMPCFNPLEERPNYIELMDSYGSEEYEKFLDTMVLEVKQIVRKFIQGINEPQQKEIEPCKNKLKFPNNEQFYDFTMSDFQFITPTTRPKQEKRRYYHKPSKTFISLTDRHGWEKKLKEIALYNKIKHPNIILYYGWCEDLRIEYICFEAMDIDLFNLLKINHIINYEKVLRYMAATIIEVLIYLNSLKYAHGNINPETVLFNFDGTIKLSGFEYAWSFENLYNLDNDIYWEEHYVPPERIFNKFSRDYKNDIWALGALLLDSVLFNNSIFYNTLDCEVLRKCGSKINEHIYETRECGHRTNGECKSRASKYYKRYKKANDRFFNRFNNIKKFIGACLKNLKNRPSTDELTNFKFYKEHKKCVDEDRQGLIEYLSSYNTPKIYSTDELEQYFLAFYP